MDEELLDITIEETVEASVNEALDTDVTIESTAYDVSTEEAVEFAEVEPVEEIEIEIEESIGWVGGDSGRHYSLTGRDDPNQHSIEAITGLRAELDEIEKLKTVYSDSPNVAGYYKWKDTSSYGSCGCFVSIVEGDKIQICDGSNIFGVVVDDAGFVGNQSNIKRNNSYGLVATSGLVDVRCELDVDIGDRVVSSTSGHAKKSASNHGYKVLGVETKGGVSYAIIALGVQADIIDALGADLNQTKEQVDANYQNIVSAVNVAYQALNKSTEATSISQEALNDALEALVNSENSAKDVQSAIDYVQGTASVAAQAKAIAEIAATSAEAMRNEAVEKAKEALDETAASRRYFNSLSTTMSNELSDVKLELSNLEGGINDYKEEVKDGYVSRTDFTAFQGENTQAIAAVKKEATDTYATITSVAELQTNTSKAIAGLRTEVTTNYATQTSLAQLKTDTTNAISASENKATKTYATKTDLTSFQGTTNTAMARIEQKADANGAYMQSTVTNIDKYSIGPHSQAYGFTLEQAASVLEEGVRYTPDKQYDKPEKYVLTNSPEELTTWDATDKDVAKVYKVPSGDSVSYYYCSDAAKNDDGEFEPVWSSAAEIPTYEVTFSQYYLYQWGKLNGVGPYRWITVDKNYSPENAINTAGPVVTFKTDSPPAAVNDDDWAYWYTNGAPTGTAADYEAYTLYKWMKYSYTDGADTKTDYHWVAVATLAGNSQNRAVSQIRQDANSIVFEVTTAKDDVAKVEARISDSETNVSSLAAWRRGDDSEQTSESIIKQTSNDNGASITISAYQRDGDGNVSNTASLVLNSTDDGSALCIDADNINFKGSEFSATMEKSINLAVGNINVGGRNLLANSDRVVTKSTEDTMAEFVQYADIAPIFDQYGLIEYTLSFDIKSADISKCSTIGVYCQNGSTSKYSIGSKSIPVTTAYVRHNYTFTPTMQDANETRSMLAFFGEYGTGNIPCIKNVKVEKGNKATDWTPATEDMATAAELQIAKDSMVAKVHDKKTGDNCSWNMTPAKFEVKAVADSVTGGITVDSSGLTVNGKINAQAGGNIGGWKIANDCLVKYGKNADGSEKTRLDDTLAADQAVIQPSGINETYTIAGHTAEGWALGIGNNFGVVTNGSVHCSNLNATGGTIGGWEIGEVNPNTPNRIGIFKKDVISESEGYCTGMVPYGGGGHVNIWAGANYDGEAMTPWEIYNKLDVPDGNPDAWSDYVPFYVTGAGQIKASSGKIGGFEIRNNGLVSDPVELTTSHALFKSAKFSLNNYVNMFNDNTNKISYITTTGERDFVIQSSNGAGIKFLAKQGNEQVSHTITITATVVQTGGSQTSRNYLLSFNYSIANGAVSQVALPYTIYYQRRVGNAGATYKYTSVDIIIPANSNSGTCERTVSGYANTQGADVPMSSISWSENGTYASSITAEILAKGTNNILYSLGSFNPMDTCAYFLGNDSKVWKSMRVESPNIISSDSRLKNSIINIPDEYATFFDGLVPVSYKYNNSDSDRMHVGFIAQEVEKSLNKAGIATKDFAGICIGTDEDKTYALRYEEFIPLNTYEIQKLKKRVAELESKLAELTPRND